MIRKFEAKHFKLFESFTLDKLGCINLVGGSNNVGKSSLLEALFLYCDQRNPQMSVRHMGWRGIRTYTTDAASFFAPLFHNLNTSSPVTLYATHDTQKHGLRLTVKSDDQFSRVIISTGEEKPSAVGHLETSDTSSPSVLEVEYLTGNRVTNHGSIQIGKGELTLKLDKSQTPFNLPAALYLGTRSQCSPQDNAQRYGDLDLRGDTEIVLKILRSLDPAIRSLSVIPMATGAMIHADIGINKKIPINFLGDGTNRAISIILAMAFARDGIALIDDIDSGVHYSVLEKLWRGMLDAAQHFNCQLVATTHSYACLKAAQSVLSSLFKPDFAYFRLERVNGGIHPVRFDYETFGTALDQELEVR